MTEGEKYCDRCGSELRPRLHGDEQYDHCPDCGMMYAPGTIEEDYPRTCDEIAPDAHMEQEYEDRHAGGAYDYPEE